MANDITIEVEARVGDALAQLTLTAGAVRMLADEADNAGSSIGDGRDNRTLSGRLSGLRNVLSNMGDRGPLGMVIRGFGNLASAMLGPLDMGMKFAENFQQIGTTGQALLGVLVSLPIAFVGVAAAIGAATFAATALASILGTLVAIAADLVAPVTLLGGLLGGLAAGFLIAAKRASDGGGKLTEFSKKLDMLKSMFGHTADELAHRFLPYLLELADASQHALNFLDRIIKLPLGQAFRALDTRGTKLLGEFVDRVAQVLSKPIRLAFRVAFDDSAFSNMVSDWWHRFVGFLFGSVEHHPIEVRPGFFKMENKTVDGVLQPFIDWWNRHHFTRQGIQLGRQILNGVLNSGMRARLVAFFAQVFRDAGRRALHAFWDSLNTPLLPLLERLWHTIDQQVNAAGHRWRQSIVSSMQSAWNAVKQAASNAWNWIVNLIESPLHINIDWPSPPSWLTSLNPFGGGGSSVPSRGGSGGSSPTNPGVARFQPRVAMAAVPFVIHIHGADLSDSATQKRVARQVGKHIANDWRRRAGGH